MAMMLSYHLYCEIRQMNRGSFFPYYVYTLEFLSLLFPLFLSSGNIFLKNLMYTACRLLGFLFVLFKKCVVWREEEGNSGVTERK